MTSVIHPHSAGTAPSEAAGGTRAFVRLERITKRFLVRKTWNEILRNPLSRSHTTVLNAVGFEVREGEFFGLLGQNGAGKTTLFRVLTTLVLPDEGSAHIGEYEVTRDAAMVRSLVAPVIANERSLYWRLSAAENLRLFAVLQRIEAGRIAAEVDRTLSIVGLSDAGHKMVGSFSSGMKQRLLIARALLGRPKVLLLDEPTRSLDPVSARDLRVFLKETIVAEQGCTVILATHDAEDVWNLCDRVGVLHRGNMLAVERTEVLRLRVGDEAYVAWIRDEQLADAVAAVNKIGVAVLGQTASPEQGWSVLSVEVGGSAANAARVLSHLHNSGISPSRFEKRPPDLAELIERVVRVEQSVA